MTAESPAQTAQRLFPLLGEGKTADAAVLFADSVSFSIPHPPGIPWVPEVDSAEGMRTFFLGDPGDEERPVGSLVPAC